MRLIYKIKNNRNKELVNINYDNADIELIECYTYNDGYGRTEKTSRICVNDIPVCIVETKDLDVLQEIFKELYSIDPEKCTWYNLEERVNEELQRKWRIKLIK